jgi:hypothetical protein
VLYARQYYGVSGAPRPRSGAFVPESEPTPGERVAPDIAEGFKEGAQTLEIFGVSRTLVGTLLKILMC